MKPLLFTILIWTVTLTSFAQQPDAVMQSNPQYSKEEKEKSDESKTQDSEQITQDLEQIKQQLKSIGEAQTQLKVDREKLKQIVINNNEVVIVKTLMVIATACESYRMDQKLKFFPRRFKELSNYLPERIINATNASNAIHGYYYKYKYVSKDRFNLKAIPVIKGETGERTFVLDETDRIINDETGMPISLEEAN